jgi:hypothetical protein
VKKNAFKAKRGHNWHIVHETKTMFGKEHACHTLCGEAFTQGEFDARRATCVTCAMLDNPLEVIPTFRVALDALAKGLGRSIGETPYEAFLRRDYVLDRAPTRRGQVLLRDWTEGPVPMADSKGMFHYRPPVGPGSLCGDVTELVDARNMSLRDYERLHLLKDSIVVTCLRCLGR